MLPALGTKAAWRRPAESPLGPLGRDVRRNQLRRECPRRVVDRELCELQMPVVQIVINFCRIEFRTLDSE